MKFGISTFVNDDTIDTVSLARAIEERGFTSLAVAEHTHIPASRQSPYPLGGDLPSIYYRTLDPFVTLAAAAAVTSTIELITGIALLIQRDPIITAKEAASIDLISGGRFVLGVGAGWNIEELRDHAPIRRRAARCSTNGSSHQGAVDHRTRRVPRPVRRFRPVLLPAQARAHTAPAGADRR